MSETFQYDAFISYSHCERDAALAQALHRQLEHYHIPRPVRDRYGKKKISRIFRDKEELGLSSNLSDNICQALDHSEFLILVCSPESHDSVWVNREVEYFIEKHGRDQVLAVLVAGEPEEVFPPILCEETVISEDEAGNPVTTTVPVEPLAADLRGTSTRASLKKLKTEKLRIISRMLGCPYDRLKQRHREYIIRRTAALSACALALLLLFLGYSGYQKRQIAINKRHSQKLQAEYRSRQSLESLKAGDRKKALDNALSPPDPSEKNDLYSNQQLYALNSALYSYKTKHIKEYVPETITDTAGFTEGSLSGDGTYYYAVNDNDEGFVFSGKTGQLLGKINTGPAEKAIAKHPGKYPDFADGSRIHRILPYGKEKCLLLLTYAACIMETSTGRIEKVFPTASDNTNIHSSTIEKDKLLLCPEELSVDLYDLKTGSRSYTSNVYEKYDSLYFLTLDSSCNGKGRLAAGASWNKEENATEEPAGLWVFDCQNNKTRKLSDIQSTNVRFVDETHIAVIHKEIPALQKNEVGRSYFTYYLAVYDVNSGEQIYTGEKMTGPEAYNAGLLIHRRKDGKKEQISILHWLNSNLMVTDYPSGIPCGQLTFDDRIVNVEKMDDDSVLAATAGGWFQEVTLTENLYRLDRMKLEASPETMHYTHSSDKIACIIEGRLAFFSLAYDEKMKELTVTDHKEREISRVDYLGEDENIFRCVILEDSSRFEDVEAKIYGLHSDHCLYHFVCREGSYRIEHMESYEYKGKTYLNLIEAGPDDDLNMPSFLHIIDLTEGTELKEMPLPAREAAADQIRYSEDHFRLFLQESPLDDHLTVYDISEDAVREAPAITFPGEIAGWEKVCGADCLLVFVREDEHTCRPLKYDISSGKIHEPDTRIDLNSDDDLTLVSGRSTDRIGIFNEDRITVLDGAGRILMQTEKLTNADSYANPDFRFFGQDRQLLVTYNNTVFLYDIASGTIKSTLAVNTTDDLLNQHPAFSLITDDSNSFFALKNESFLSTYTRSSTKKMLFIISVDEKMEMSPFAEVAHGYVSFSGKEVSVESKNLLEYTGIYDYDELKKEARELLTNRFK